MQIQSVKRGAAIDKVVDPCRRAPYLDVIGSGIGDGSFISGSKVDEILTRHRTRNYSETSVYAILNKVQIYWTRSVTSSARFSNLVIP